METPTDEFMVRHPESDSISPLPSTLHDGLVAISVFAFLSFILTSSLFLYLTCKLVAWHFKKRAQAARLKRNIDDAQPVPDFSFEDGAFGPQGQSSKAAHDQQIERVREVRDSPPNQFLILVFNLIIADMHQGAAFLLSARWLQQGGIFIDDSACFVQGLFDSNGDLSSSLFITSIAVHTYLSVVKRYRPPQKVLYGIIVMIWIFVYALALIPLLATRNGRGVGGYFVRAGPWCWINEAYENLRLLTHYLFIFISLVTTTILYILIFLNLRRQSREQHGKAGQDESRVQLSHNPAFLIYPLIYVLCTLPLAMGRIATMAGAHVPLGYYCFAGTLISSNGSFDCLLFGTTRQTIVFASTDKVDSEDTGLETFAFMRTPANQFGNSVWIQGGDNTGTERTGWVGGWWRRAGGTSGLRSSHMRGGRSVSQESLRGAAGHDMAIQMDVVTSVAVEVEPSKERDARYPSSSMDNDATPSSGEKQFTRTFGP